MADKVSAWQASDGTIYMVEQDAKDRDFEIALRAWAEDYYNTPRDDPLSEHAEQIVASMIAERMNLLPIFKILNGGNTLALPPRTEEPQ